MMKLAYKAVALSVMAMASTLAMAEESNALSQAGVSFAGTAAFFRLPLSWCDPNSK